MQQGGLALMAQAQERMLRASEGLSTGDGDFLEGVTDLSRAKFDMQMGVKLIKLGDEVLGSLLDIVA